MKHSIQVKYFEDQTDQALHTDNGLIFESEQAAKDHFNLLKQSFNVERTDSHFVFELFINGKYLDTAFVTKKGFEEITKRKPLSNLVVSSMKIWLQELGLER